MTQTERRLFLIKTLKNENKMYDELEIPRNAEDQKALLRGLVNLRPAGKTDSGFMKIEKEYLEDVLSERGVTDADTIQPVSGRLAIWQGDITTLKADAIVNAANSGMTGCYYPNHRCIDNAIHTFAGTELRLFCDEMMKKQGYEEPTGKAKITPGFNLPCRYVLHTVGPIVRGKVTEKEKDELASCYRSCLELAEKNGVKSIAFCCISTGEFHFPNRLAAEIAVKTVRKYLSQGSEIGKVIFNVFKEIDREIYQELLGEN